MTPGERLWADWMRDQHVDNPEPKYAPWRGRPAWYRRGWQALAKLPRDEAFALADNKRVRMQAVADGWNWSTNDNINAQANRLQQAIREEFER